MAASWGFPAFTVALPWSPGEQYMHRLMNVPEHDNPTSTALTAQAGFLLQRAPLLAIGIIDDQGRPWSTVWGGETGFSQPLGSSVIGTRTVVDRKNDPVVQALLEGRDDGKVVKSEGAGRMVGGLTIDLVTRKRVKLYGRMVAAALDPIHSDDGLGDTNNSTSGNLQLVVNIEQSMGNCPKYLNKKIISPAPTLSSKLLSQSSKLSPEALGLLEQSDLFFISSANADLDMDTNHRGGPRGFVRMLSNEDDGAELVYPEYSGNRLYQTLGNLATNPAAGLVFLNFLSGDALYVTGTTEILTGNAASELLPHSNLVVKIKIIEARYVQQGLPFRGTTGEYSPYNPSVRLLAKEGSLAASLKPTATNTAKLIKKTQITPDIYRYRFAMSNPEPYKAGQWAALDFSGELDMGYSHMRDDDPRSLNDDFMRTFTISSHPNDLPPDEFEMTVKSVGTVTSFLARQNTRYALEVPLRGIGGDFVISSHGDEAIPFVAGGVGITPLLAQLSDLPLDRLKLFWSLRSNALGMALNSFDTHPGLVDRTTLFVTGHVDSEAERRLDKLRVLVERRRISEADLKFVDAKTWYLCAGPDLRKILQAWLHNRTLILESFNY